MTRLFDIVLSAAALLLLSPLLLLVAAILKLTGEGKVFFIQQRVGQDGELFELYKFATMLKDSPNIGSGTITLKDDPRVLPVGKFLRRTKINELPQLLNVLQGDMSVIGPRPQTLRCYNAFPIKSQEAIKTVRPGLSGIGSIVFRYEEELMIQNTDVENFYDTVVMPYKGSLEEWYVTNRSVATYLRCIWVTFIVIANPSPSIVWSHFRNLPAPPPILGAPLGFSRAKH